VNEARNHPTEEVSMKKPLLVLTAIVSATTLAACGSGGGGDGSTTTAETGTGSGTVSVKDVGDADQVLVDSSGRALYSSEQEANGKVMCTGSCEAIWAPLTIDTGQPTGSDELGVVKRPDGSRQVTYDGAPLYSFTQEGPNEVTGDGLTDEFDGQQFTWHVASTDEGGGSSNTSSDGAYRY
jgi:predicted lipoprotein with Yx(FWY)xxD motif